MRAIAVLVMFAACSYSDPEIAGTRFRCDGAKPCPTAQTCAGGFCVANTHDGVKCVMEPTCSASQQCCDDGVNPRHCIASTANCLVSGAFCDGLEDCPAGQVCCAVGTDQVCRQSCSRSACQQPEDCPTDEPHCCVDTSEPAPWGFCQLDPC